LGEAIKKVYLATNGCPENRNDLARMQKYLEHNEYIQTNELKEADLVLFNACGLTNHDEDVSVNLINHLKKNKQESAELVVYGCLPKINKKRLDTVYKGITFGSDEVEKISKIIGPSIKPKNPSVNYLHPHIYSILNTTWKLRNCLTTLNPRELRNKFFNVIHKRYNNAVNAFHSGSYIIKISTGCLGACSFCAVKLSRGKVKSKSISAIIKEFNEGLQAGYTEFSFIGTDLGSYGLDRKTNLAKLLKKIVSIPGDYNIRLRNIHPKYLKRMLPEMKSIFATGKISFISVSSESGNDRILKLMKRGYTIDEYIDMIQSIKSSFSKIKIRNQMMVGFPGETDEEFQDSMRLLDILDVDITEIYKFSPRIGTKAALLPDPVTPKIASRRYGTLLKKSVLSHWMYKNKEIAKHENFLQSLPQNLVFPKHPKILQN